MTFDLEEAIAVLERTPAVLRAWLDGLPQSWLDAREAEGTWSPVEVIGHLVLGERTDWVPRARQILEHGDAAVFEPFDRFGHLQRGRQSVAELLDEFAELRRQSVAQLRTWNLQETDWKRPGLHPEFGRVNLGQLLATWVVHDLTHLAQITRVMAKRYREDVGPWIEYLSVLK